MRLSLCAPVYDTQGHIWLTLAEGADMRTISRRANRKKTLDGGAAFNDFGHSPADRTLVVVFREERGEYRVVERLLKLYPFLIISTPDGVFYAKPVNLTQQGLKNTLRLLVKEELS